MPYMHARKTARNRGLTGHSDVSALSAHVSEGLALSNSAHAGERMALIVIRISFRDF